MVTKEVHAVAIGRTTKLGNFFAEWQVTVSRKRTGGRLYYYVHTHKTIHPASTKISWL